MNNIHVLIASSNWHKIFNNYNTCDIAKSLSFKDGIILAYRMLYNEQWDEQVQNYAVDLLYAIRETYSDDWNSCWKYDVFLGNACNIALRYDERYQAYKRATEKVQPIPPSLMVLLAKCYISPGIPPISQEEAENLLKEALKKETSIEGISLIKRISERKKDARIRACLFLPCYL